MRHDPHCQHSLDRRRNTFHEDISWRCSFSTCSFSLCCFSLCRLLHNRLGRFCCVRCTIAVDAGVRNHFMLGTQAIHTSTDSTVSPHLSIVVLIARHGGHGREKPGRRMPGNYIDSCSEQQNIRRTCQTWITIDVAAAMPQVYYNFITTTITELTLYNIAKCNQTRQERNHNASQTNKLRNA